MSIATTSNRISYAGNSVTTIFSFPYYFQANADLVVVLRNTSTGVETPQVLTTDYTVTGAGVASGGSVTMLVAPPTGNSLIIYGSPTLTQGVDLAENDSLPAETLEGSLDKLTLIAQRLKDRVDRSVRISDGFSPTFDPLLPADLDQAEDRVPTLNSTATGFAPVSDWPTAADIAAAAPNAAAAAASEAAAAASEAAAATSASSAATAVASIIWRDVVFYTFANSPVTLVDADRGKFFAFDCTGGNIVVNLPAISALTFTAPWTVALKKTDVSANTVTMNRASTDTIDGATTKVLGAQGSGCVLVPDTDPAPDTWTSQDFGSIADLGVTTAKLAESVFDGLTAVTAELNDYVAIADTSDSNKKKKALASSIKNNKFRSVTTTDSPSITADETLLLSGASFTVTLPTAVSNAGKIFDFIHNGTSLTQIYTFNTTSAQTISGIASGSLAMYTTGEVFRLVSDGANWVILEHKCDTAWANYPSTISLTGVGTATSIEAKWRRVGVSLQVRAKWVNGTTTATSFKAGLPGGTIDTAQLLTAQSIHVGSCFHTITGSPIAIPTSNRGPFAVIVVSGVSDGVGVSDSVDLSTGNFTVTLGTGMAATGQGVSIEFEVPMTGWQP